MNDIQEKVVVVMPTENQYFEEGFCLKFQTREHVTLGKVTSER